MRESLIKPAGLITDPNAISGAPPGALSEALNVVIRRDGIVQPRPGFQRIDTETDDGDPIVTGAVVRMLPWKSALLLGTTSGILIVDPRDGSVLNGPTPADVLADAGSGLALRGVESRSNLYFTAKDGVRKYTSTTDADPILSGVNGRPFVAFVAITGASGWMTQNDAVAYRFTLVRRDENEVVVESSPSGRFALFRSSSGTGNVQLVIVFPPEAQAGDEIVVYRSDVINSAANLTPPDDMQIATTYVLTSADIAAGSVTLVDTTEQVDLGAALYTNDDEEGALQANDPPPRVQDLQNFRGSMWGADIDGRKQAILTYTAYENNGDYTASTSGIGRRIFTGTATLGNATLTSVNDTTGVEAGMLVEHAGFTWGAVVISKTSNTIVMSAVASANSAATGGTAYDTIQLGSQYFRNDSPLSLASGVNHGTVSGTKFSSDGLPSTYYVASLLTTFTLAGGEQFIQVLIEQRYANASVVFVVNATHGSEYTPALAATGTVSATDNPFVDANDVPNGLIYSKTDQPEAMPTTNTILVGTSTYRIDRILATRDALWVFKRDGIFRVTGTGAGGRGAPADWRVDPFDVTNFLVATDSAVVMNEAIYAWTNRGIVKISDAGVAQLSAPFIDNLIDAQQRLIAPTPLNSYNSTAYQSGWGIANLKDDEYILAVPSTESDAQLDPEYLYVFNTVTLAFVRWTVRQGPLYHGVALADNGDLCLATSPISTRVTIAVERAEPDAPTYDTYEQNSAAITVTQNADGTYHGEIGTITAYTPAVGDKVVNGLQSAFITSLDDTNPTTEFNLSAIITDGATCLFAESYDCDTRFTARRGEIGSDKAWGAGTVEWGSLYLTDGYAVGFESTGGDRVALDTPVTEDVRNEDVIEQSSRFWVPRTHARAGALSVDIDIRQADTRFQLFGITLNSAGMRGATRR